MNMKLIGGFATAVMLVGGLSLAQAEEVKSKAARPAAKKSDRSSREAIIKRFDKDGDGKLGEDERRAAAEYRKKLASRNNAKGSDNDRRDQGARERYAAVAKRISEGVKAGKITEEQGRERLAAFRKNMAEGRRDSDSARPSRASREELTKRFDKNGDGKLDREEGAAARKAITARRGQGQGGENAERRGRGISVEEYRRGEAQIRELVNKGKVSKEDAEKRLIEMRKAIRSEKPKGDSRGSQGGSERGERSRNRDSDRRSSRATDRRQGGRGGENAERRRRGSQRGEGGGNRRRSNRRGGE